MSKKKKDLDGFDAVTRDIFRKWRKAPWSNNLNIADIIPMAKFLRASHPDAEMARSLDFLLNWEFKEVDKILERKDTVAALQIGLEIGTHWAAVLNKIAMPNSPGPSEHYFCEVLREAYRKNPTEKQVSLIASAKAQYEKLRRSNPKLPKRIPKDKYLENNFLAIVKRPSWTPKHW